MVMEHETGKKNIGKFLKYEQDRYLMSRSMERKKEVPLDLVDDQQYIAYNKGSIALYALRDYIGETSLNAALRDFVRFYSYHEAPYPTSVDLIAYIEKSVPDSLNYLVNDLFRTITLFGNRIDSCHYSILENGKYEVSFSATTEKFRADSLGNQEQVTPADWIDIGVFAEGSDGKDSLIYIRQVRVDTNQVNCQVILDIKPTKVGIDPLNLLIDRNLTDNVKTIKEKG